MGNHVVAEDGRVVVADLESEGSDWMGVREEEAADDLVETFLEVGDDYELDG